MSAMFFFRLNVLRPAQFLQRKIFIELDIITYFEIQICNTLNFQVSLLLTWFNFNPSMDK